MIDLLSGGKLDGQLDPNRLYLVIKRGQRVVVYDLLATINQQRAIIVRTPTQIHSEPAPIELRKS